LKCSRCGFEYPASYLKQCEWARQTVFGRVTERGLLCEACRYALRREAQSKKTNLLYVRVIK